MRCHVEIAAAAVGALAILIGPVVCSAGRASEPAPPRPPLIEDDPALSRALRLQMKEPEPPEMSAGERLAGSMWRYGPRFTAGYRLGKLACSVGDCWYHQFSLMFYPLAIATMQNPWWRLVRFGLGVEGGGETEQTRQRWWQRNQTLAGVIALGLQLPHRVTPYVDFVVTMGALHRHIYNKDLFHFVHSVGLEAGAAVFVWRSFLLEASAGWRRSVVKVDPKTLYYDTFTFKIGMGF